MTDDLGVSPSGPGCHPFGAEPVVSGKAGIPNAVPDIADLLAALATVPDGWWWSVGTCSVSNDASIGPDVAYCDKQTLIRFDDGLHADLHHPSTIAEAVRDCVQQAKEAGIG